MLSAAGHPRAVIVGGGIAGLASAIALGRAGWRCSILEREPTRRRLGHGMLLPASGRRALERLGVGGIAPSSAPVDAFELCGRDGRRQQLFPTPGALSLLHRDLLSLLRRALPLDVRLIQQCCVGLEPEPGAPERAPRLRVVSDTGERWPADLIVAADGVGSACRRALFPAAQLTPELVTELVLHLKNTVLVEGLNRRCRKFQDCGSGLALGLLPCRGGRLVVYAQFATGRHPAPRPDAFLPFLRERFGGWNPLLEQLLAVLDTGSAHLWRTTDLDPLPQLHHGNVVLVGDSAHPLLPFTSQGSPAALEDALRLAAVLAGVDGRDPRARGEALARYSSGRLPELLPLLLEGRALRRRFLEPPGPEAEPLPPLVGFHAGAAGER